MALDWEHRLFWAERHRSPHLGVRFDAAGRFLAEHGNTVVAQVVPGSPTEAALIGLRAALQARPEAGHFAFTEVASYHMTVFEGAIETRRAGGFWPDGVPLEAGIDAVTSVMAGRLAGFAAPPAFAMRVTAVTPFGVRLAGATAADEAVARAWRDGLSDALGLRTPAHAAYEFHITLAYLMQGLPAAALPGLRADMARLTGEFVTGEFVAGEFVAGVPVLHLARPKFCRFADMNAFAPVLDL